jgi:nitronate monooxygenase
MGGGPSTPALVTGAAEAGAVGFLAAGYKTTAAVSAEVAAVRQATDAPFGVNLFVPGRPATDAGALASYLETLGPDVAALGCTLGEPAWDDDGWDEKVAVLLAAPPSMVSFTFGCPDPDVIDAFQRAGSLVTVTVTTPEETEEAAGAHADALCVQGFEAGAHRGSFTNGFVLAHPDAPPAYPEINSATRPLRAAAAAAGDVERLCLRSLRAGHPGSHPC